MNPVMEVKRALHRARRRRGTVRRKAIVVGIATFSLACLGLFFLSVAMNRASAQSTHKDVNVKSSLESEIAKLVSPSPSQNARFGASMAMEGDTVVIGSPQPNVGSVSSGAVHVFTRTSAGGWEAKAQLTSTDPSQDALFGATVAISNNIIVVGAPRESIGSITSQGAVYIFNNSDKGWTFGQKLTVSDGFNASLFGSSVAIDHDTLVIGANHAGRAGAAYIFFRDNGTWNQQGSLVDVGSTNFNEQFGGTVSVSGDTAIVGAMGGDIAGHFPGIVCVFVRNSGVWSLQARLAPSDAIDGDQFGKGLTISGDTLVVGAPENQPAGIAHLGATYVFERNGTTWTQQQKLIRPQDATGGKFGAAVAISGDRIIAGAFNSDVRGNSNQGDAYVFVRGSSGWFLQNRLTASDGHNSDFLGTSVAIQGNRFFAGAPGADLPNNNEGAVYFFLESPSPPDLQASSDTGASQTDNLTNAQNLVFDVHGITPGATVQFIRNNVVIESRVVQASDAVFTDLSAPANQTSQYFTRQVVQGETSSISEPLEVKVDTIEPTVTVSQAPGQLDPVGGLAARSLSFRVDFSEPISGFDQADVSLTGSTADVSSATVSISSIGTNAYNAEIQNVVSNGQAVKINVSTGAAIDPAGNVSGPPVILDDAITVDNVSPICEIDQASNQADPTNDLPLNFIAVCSESLIGLDSSDISFAGSTAPVAGRTVTITGGGAKYLISVGNISSNGQIVRASIPSNVTTDLFGNSNLDSTSLDNVVTLDNVPPSVTINKSSGQADPTTTQPIKFKVIFNEAVTDFTSTDVSLLGSTANTTFAHITVSGTGTTYDVSIQDIVSSGQVVASVPAGVALDALNNPNRASTSTDNSVGINIQPFADITGRITTTSGLGIFGAIIEISSNGGPHRFARTNPFGYFRFFSVSTGAVDITVSAKNFQSNSQTFGISKDLSNLILTLEHN